MVTKEGDAVGKSKIRTLRLNKGLEPKEATEKLGISYSMLNKIERGDRQPGRNLIIGMSELYGCTIDEIYKATSK